MSIYNSIKKNIPLNYKRKVKKAISTRQRLIELCALVMPETSCFDIGASYYPHPEWRVFLYSQKTNWIAIEPNSENLNYIKKWEFPANAYAVTNAVSQNGGEQLFYKTNIDSGSSLLKPQVHDNMLHRIDKKYLFPYEEKTISTISFKNVFRSKNNDRIALIKLDTQGSELSILKSLDKKDLEKYVICIELESTLLAKPCHKGNSKFHDVTEFMENLGFELAALKPIPVTTISENKKYRSVINECDAVYIKRSDIITKSDLNYQLAALGCYVAYKTYSEALFIIRSILSQKTDKKLNSCLVNNLIKIEKTILKS